MGERIQNSVLAISFTDLIRDWFLGHVTHWQVEHTAAIRSDNLNRTLITSNCGPLSGFYGVIVDEEQPCIFFRYQDEIEPNTGSDIRAFYPTSPSFFDDLLLSIRTIDAHMRADYQCKGHPGTFRMIV